MSDSGAPDKSYCSYLCFLVSSLSVISSLFFDNKESRLDDKNAAKCQYKTIRPPSHVKTCRATEYARVFYFFSEGINALSKSCSCFLRFHITPCKALVLNYFVQRILSLFLEDNIDLSYFAPPRSSLFFGKRSLEHGFASNLSYKVLKFALVQSVLRI